MNKNVDPNNRMHLTGHAWTSSSWSGLPPRGMEYYWERLDDVIQREPLELALRQAGHFIRAAVWRS